MDNTDTTSRPLRLVGDELSAEAEQEWDSVGSPDQFLSAIGRYTRLTADEETQLARRIEKGDQEARQRLIESNLYLVVAIARNHRHARVPFLDLIQEGVLGLMYAVDWFDWRLGNTFSIYARWWIQQAILGALAQFDADPANSAERVVRAVPDDSQPAPTDALHQQEAEAALRGALARLPERHRRALELRYGLDGGEQRTHEAVGRLLGVSAARACELERRALQQLRAQDIGIAA